ncbi:MAG: hypothetical protein IVW54_18920 [Candidatus Binataceae bacterium]|nr:hypothetical protein [Candidatus Binataceae bacterium]
MARITLRFLITNDRVAIGERAIHSRRYSAREIVKLTQSESRLLEIAREDGQPFENADVVTKRIAEVGSRK